MVALLLGQDANWDLRNYHLYNGYALLHGRLTLDLAPAQMQSYFSPVLDVFHYLLMVHLPAPVAGFVLGTLHGLVFLPVAGIAMLVLQGQPQQARLAPLLAMAGLCASSFLSEFGSSMADNTTALFVLGSLCFVLRAQQRQQQMNCSALGIWMLAGALLGIAVAFKLTNAVYAVALGLAALCAGGPARRRLLGTAVLTLSALALTAVLAGWWYLQMWQHFGNPLFPQFNAFFQGALAAPVSVGDTRWLPHGAWEQLTWPVQFTAQPLRISEKKLVQYIWPLLYLSTLALIALRMRGASASSVFVPAMRVVLVFFGMGYVMWQGMFSIHRYLVVLELLAPLLLWYFCRQLLPMSRAAKWGGWAIGLCTLASLLGWNTWGHERWAREGFTVTAPPMPEPERSIVLLVGGEPQAWRVPLLPAQARYVGVATNFPESEGYGAHLAVMLDERDRRYAMINAPSDRSTQRFERLNDWVERLQLSRGRGCERLRWLARRIKGLRSEVEEDDGRCRLVPRLDESSNVDDLYRQERDAASKHLARYGLKLDKSSCVTLSSYIGRKNYPYQWCRVRR